MTLVGDHTGSTRMVTGNPARNTRDPVRVAARYAPLIGLLASIAVVAWGWHTGVLRTQEELQAFIASVGIFGPVVFILLSTASVIFPIVPGALLVVAGPILFGPIEGTLYNYIAVCAGSIIDFALARRYGLALIERCFSPATVEKWLGWTRKRHFTGLFALAIALPVAPDDLLCYLAGTTRMRSRTFVLIILTCKPWALLAYGLGVSQLLLRFLPW